MKERPKCFACGKKTPFDSTPCDDCPGHFCSVHEGKTQHLCGALFEPWRGLVEADLKLVEYSARRRPPISIVQQGGDLEIKLWPDLRLPDLSAGLRLLTFAGVLMVAAVHPQQAADMVALACTLPPLSARGAVVSISGVVCVEGRAGTTGADS